MSVDVRRDTPDYFEYADQHGFRTAIEMCNGAGVCRKRSGGTMCPSYMVTLEEEHSTRGRARLLFEMLQGDPVGRNGWRDEHEWPLARTMYSASPSSSTEPPVSRLALRTASMTRPCGIP